MVKRARNEHNGEDGTRIPSVSSGKSRRGGKGEAQVPLMTLANKSLLTIDQGVRYITGKDVAVQDDILKEARGPIAFGMWIVIIFFGFFIGWAAFAPIDSAAIAIGTVVVDSNKKTIQHLEGGIISEILVKEGQHVKEGQPLLRLDQTTAKARQELLLGQFRATKALEARLIAERDGLDSIPFNQGLLDSRNDPAVAKLLDTQQRLFETRKESLNGQLDVLRQRVAQFNDQIRGFDAQQRAAGRQLELINQEIAVVQQLLQTGNAQKPRLLALQRQAAELAGNQGEYRSNIAKARQSITEAELQMSNLKTDRLKEVMSELRDTQVQAADLLERIRSSSDILNRITVTAPQDGIITGLQVHTVGGVIGAGAPLMDIVPQNDKLVIDAKVAIQDIDVVHAGLTARVRLSAYRTRYVPMIDGKVVNVSADRFIDEATHMPYYKARIEIDQDMMNHINKHVELYPGMPADVLIVTGSRTLLEYLINPLRESMEKAFREQ